MAKLPSTTPEPDLGRLYPAHLATMQARFEEALAATGFDGLVILAGDLKAPPRDDVTYAFRVEPHFATWLPLNRVPGAALVLTPGKKPILLYPQEDDFWLAPARAPEGFWVEHFDVRIIRTRASESRELTELGTGFAVIGDAGPAEAAFRARNDAKLLARLDYARAAKTEYELACMSTASRNLQVDITPPSRGAASAKRSGCGIGCGAIPFAVEPRTHDGWTQRRLHRQGLLR